MCRNDRALQLVKTWVDKVGKKDAIRRLVIQEVAPVTAEKIVCGRYEATPRDLLAKVLIEEMAKDGVVLPDEKAS